MQRPTNQEMIIMGLTACPEDGRVHTWKTKSRNSNSGHSFGAAAMLDRITDEVVVTMYADVYGKRTGEAYYWAEQWDGNFIKALKASKGTMRDAYEALERLTTAFGHRSLRTMVEIDETKSPAEQVSVIQETGQGRQPRIITDSIKSVAAFVAAAEQGLYDSRNLLEVTEFISVADYHKGTHNGTL